MKAMRIASLAMIVSMLAVGVSVGGYTSETFTVYSVGDTFTTKLNGWQADTSTVTIVDDVYSSATKSMYVATEATVSNNLDFAIGADAKIWTDFRIRPMLGVASTSNLPTNAASIIMYFDSEGYVGIYTNGGFNVCTTDIWGASLEGGNAEIDADSFAEVAIFQDFQTHSNIVFVNGVAVMQDLPMLNVPTDYNYFVVANVDSNAWIDDINVQTNYSGTNTTTDTNGNGIHDVDEAHDYGYLGRTLYIDGGVDYYTFQGAIDGYRELDTLSVETNTYEGTVTVDKDLVLTGDAFTFNGTLDVEAGRSFTMMQAVDGTGTVNVAAGATLFVTNDLTADTITVADTATLIATADITVDTLTLDGDMDLASGYTLTVTDTLDLNGNMDVASGSTLDLGTLNLVGTLALASGCTLDVAGTLTLDGTMDVAGSCNVTLDTLTLNGIMNVAENSTFTLETLTLDGTMDIGSGSVLTLNTAFNMGAAGTGTVDAATINAVSMDMGTDARLDVMNSGTLAVGSPDIDLIGDYTIYGEYWPGPSVVGLPFEDDFELYAPGSQIGNYGFFGWYTSDTNIQVVTGTQDGVPVAAAGSKGLILPDNTTLSNRVTTAETNIWTTYWIRANRGSAPRDPATNTASFLGFVNTNGYMEIAVTNAGGWKVCDSAVTNPAENAVATLATNTYRRIDINAKFDGGTSGQVALFVGGILVAQEETFPGEVSTYKSLIAKSKDGDAYIDEIRISRVLPPGMTADIDEDGMPDGFEVHQYGNLAKSPLGALFKFR